MRFESCIIKLLKDIIQRLREWLWHRSLFWLLKSVSILFPLLEKLSQIFFFFCCWSKAKYINYICCRLPFTTVYPTVTTSAFEVHCSENVGRRNPVISKEIHVIRNFTWRQKKFQCRFCIGFKLVMWIHHVDQQTPWYERLLVWNFINHCTIDNRHWTLLTLEISPEFCIYIQRFVVAILS